MSRFVLAIDQGTTGTTVSLLDHQAKLVARADQDFQQIFPQPGWVEHRPEDIWQSVLQCIERAVTRAGVNANDIAAIGITNQRETIVMWDRKSSTPVHNAIVWQCRRTTDFCQSLRRKKQDRLIKNKTGLVVDPYFSASKVHWLLKHVEGAGGRAARGELAVGTIDTFLLWKLTGGRAHKTDVSNASRTMLMNIQTGAWDEELIGIFKVPKSLLPDIESSTADFGRTRGVPGLPDGIPITGIAGDQQAALFGQACFAAGESKCTFGTGSFILLNTGHRLVRSRSGILSTVAWRLRGEKKMTYALEGGAFVCGAAVQWLRDGLGVLRESSEIESLAAQVADSGGVEFVPALVGLGAPHWVPDARGLVLGLTRGTTRAHLARATLEAMALQNVDILGAMQRDLGKRIRVLRVDGGASANDLLMQMQADYLGITVERPQYIETTSSGAAFLAGLGAGFWKDVSELRRVWQTERRFQSQISGGQRKTRLTKWHRAVDLTARQGR
jgi:glycerol kinase